MELYQQEEIVGKAIKALLSVFQNIEAYKIADQKVQDNEPGMSLHQEKQGAL